MASPIEAQDPIKDPRRMNNFARTHLGFFFTSSADNQKEMEILQAATITISNALRDCKIRAGNLHDDIPYDERPTVTTTNNWAQVGILVENLGKSVQAHAVRIGLDSLTNLDAAFAWASALVFSSMGARNEMIERIKERERNNNASSTKPDTDGFVPIRSKKSFK
jgi:hypothetical protein